MLTHWSLRLSYTNPSIWTSDAMEFTSFLHKPIDMNLSHAYLRHWKRAPMSAMSSEDPLLSRHKEWAFSTACNVARTSSLLMDLRTPWKSIDVVQCTLRNKVVAMIQESKSFGIQFFCDWISIIESWNVSKVILIYWFKFTEVCQWQWQWKILYCQVIYSSSSVNWQRK